MVFPQWYAFLGIREDSNRGRPVNDETHKTPLAHLLNYIEYGAHDAGADVQLVEDHDTSKVAKRTVEKFSKPLSEAGVVLARPLTQVITQCDPESANFSITGNSIPVEPHGFAIRGCEEYYCIHCHRNNCEEITGEPQVR